MARQRDKGGEPLRPTLGTKSLKAHRDKVFATAPEPKIYPHTKASLASAHRLSEEFRVELEMKLSGYSLIITDTSKERELTSTIIKYWPSSLEANKVRIPFAFYKELETLKESGADYIMERYELAHGDLDGTEYLDAYHIAKLIEEESWRAYYWLKNASEHQMFVLRVAEVLFDWSTTALKVMKKLRALLSDSFPLTKDLSEGVGGHTAPILARGGQTVLRHRMRECTLAIRKESAKLETFFGGDNLDFYQDHLQPTQDVAASTMRGVSGDTARRTIFVNTAYSTFLERNQHIIDDLARRHQIFFLATKAIIDGLTERKTNRVLYSRLAKHGKSNESVRGTVFIQKSLPREGEELYPSLSLEEYRDSQPRTIALQEALKGSFGTPGKYNPFVTQSDPAFRGHRFLGSLPWSPIDDSVIGVHPSLIIQALQGIENTVTADNLTELTDGSITELHDHSGLLPGSHASTHHTGGTDEVYFSSLERSSGDSTLHDSYTTVPHISSGSKTNWDTAYTHSADSTIHLSAPQKTDLTDSGDCGIHHHDGRYYTSSQVDSAFLKVDTSNDPLGGDLNFGGHNAQNITEITGQTGVPLDIVPAASQDLRVVIGEDPGFNRGFVVYNEDDSLNMHAFGMGGASHFLPDYMAFVISDYPAQSAMYFYVIPEYETGFNVEVDMNANKIVDLKDPTEDQDASTKKYVDDHVGAATAAGNDTEIQFNDGGTILGGDADFTWDKSSDTLTVNGVIAHTGDTVGFFSATPATQDTGWSVSGVSTNRTVSSSMTVADLRDVVGTLINQLKTYGWLGS